MARLVLALGMSAAFSLVACGGGGETTVVSESQVSQEPGGELTAQGVGPVTTGQSPAAARESFGPPDEQRREPGCELSGHPQKQLAMVWHLDHGSLTLQFDAGDRFSSYRTTSPELPTEAGIRVGDSFSSLRDGYGATLRPLDIGAASTPRAGFWYVGRNLDSALLFSLAGGKVRSISGGSIQICE